MTTPTLEVVSSELRNIAQDLGEIKHGMKNVQISQNAQGERLIRMEERHDTHKSALDRAFTSIKDHDNRIQQIELEQPMTKMVRGWVITAVLAMVGGGGLGAYVLTKVADRPVQVIIKKSDVE
jgi:hypothetical protein